MLGAPNANAAREFPVVLMPCGKMLWKGVWNQAARVVCNKIRCPYSQLLSGLSALFCWGVLPWPLAQQRTKARNHEFQKVSDSFRIPFLIDI
jgi:hypothetical protein